MKQLRGVAGLSKKLSAFSMVGLLGLSGAALVACSSDSASERAEDVGSLGVNLKVAPGVTLTSVTYSITGNGFSKEGSIDVGKAPTISARIGGIPAGNGYTIVLSATALESGATFTGSAKFNVTAHGTTAVTVHLKGKGSTGNGSVSVNGTLNVAPVVDELTVTPLTVYVGGSVTLSGVGRDPDDGPSPLSYYWSTTGGRIDDPIAPSSTLTSDTPGTFEVVLTVSDGESTDSVSTTVTFVRPEEEGGGGAGGAGPGDGRRPNILFIIADDWGAESTSLYPELVGDSGAVPVPNIEALAENGLVFDDAWASPVCSPTRGTIISGQYGHRTGVTTVGNVLPTDTVTLFDRLTADASSYSQAFFGKYHVGGGSIDPRPGVAYPDVPRILQHVRDLGITTFRGILGGGVVDYYNWSAYDINGPAIPTTTYATTALADFAIDYITEHEAARPDEPWFLYQSFNAPHAANGGNNPYQVPPPELHSVDLRSVGNPAPGTYGTNVPIYKANIQALDTEIGRLLEHVNLETTTVIFVGDNGTPAPVKDTGSKIRGSKGSVYEGGLRVPLVVAGAGVTRRGREDDLFVTTDIYATVLSLAGVPVSQVNNSYSFTPLLDDEAASNGRRYSFSETSNGTSQRRYAIKDKRFKLTYNLGVSELFDLVADPQETTNLINSEAHAAVRATLEAEIDKLRAQAPAGYFPL